LIFVMTVVGPASSKLGNLPSMCLGCNSNVGKILGRDLLVSTS